MSNASERFNVLGSEPAAVHHRLSWFATVQGLLFLSFLLFDKSNFSLVSVLVCGGVAMCLPAIAATYAEVTLRNGLRFLLALAWVAIGLITFLYEA